jgi:polysaccharide export outer membrane protein
MRRSGFTRVGALALIMAWGCASTDAHSATAPTPLADAALRDQAVAVIAPVDDYRIGPQDTLEINVFQLNDLNRTVQVDSGGHILLPLLGQVQASGKTSSELSIDLQTLLEQKYVNNPQVTVVVKDAQGQRITVDGAVTSPGVYALTGPTTLMQAVALAKGPDTHLANLHKVIVFRLVGTQRTTIAYDLAAIRDGKAADPLVYGKDVIVVDASGSRSFMRDLGAVVPALEILRWAW